MRVPRPTCRDACRSVTFRRDSTVRFRATELKDTQVRAQRWGVLGAKKMKTSRPQVDPLQLRLISARRELFSDIVRQITSGPSDGVAKSLTVTTLVDQVQETKRELATADTARLGALLTKISPTVHSARSHNSDEPLLQLAERIWIPFCSGRAFAQWMTFTKDQNKRLRRAYVRHLIETHSKIRLNLTYPALLRAALHNWRTAETCSQPKLHRSCAHFAQYKVYSRVCKSWIALTLTSKIINASVRRLEQQLGLVKGLRAWSEAIAAQKAAQPLAYAALCWCVHRELSRCWQRWTPIMARAVERAHMNGASRRFRTQSCLSVAFYAWLELAGERMRSCLRAPKIGFSARWRWHWLTRGFNAWVEAAASRSIELVYARMSVSQRTQSKLTSCRVALVVWHANAQRLARYQLLGLVIDRRSGQLYIRRPFARWCEYVNAAALAKLHVEEALDMAWRWSSATRSKLMEVHRVHSGPQPHFREDFWDERGLMLAEYQKVFLNVRPRRLAEALVDMHACSEPTVQGSTVATCDWLPVLQAWDALAHVDPASIVAAIHALSDEEASTLSAALGLD